MAVNYEDNRKKWDNLFREFTKSDLYKYRPAANVMSLYIDWLRENYYPGRKIVQEEKQIKP
jgi:hypothetical protein